MDTHCRHMRMHIPPPTVTAHIVYPETRKPRLALRILLTLAIALAASPALGQTPYVPPESIGLDEPWPTGPEVGERAVEWPTGRINYLFELDQIVAFLDLWQHRDPGPDFGGMIEAEAGPLGEEIQTDNTLEAIWVWSHYTELTGSAEYLDNIADAWVYVLNFPPWLEEGGDGYYRVHNAAWGLTAESAYRSATADSSYLGFAAACADYIVDTPLNPTQYHKLNAFTQGWAAGNLYIYGEEMADSSWMSAAVQYGEDLLDWVDYDPPTQLAAETWAMSSGTLVWGICNSIFQDDPLRGQQWIAHFGAMVDTFQVWYNNPGDYYDWDNAWNVGYVNGHFAMGEVSGNPVYTGFGEKLTRQLLSYDTDDDGGIPATTQDPVTEDMTWVTCYLAKFGVTRLLGDPPEVDAGLLTFLSPSDQDTILWPSDEAIPIRVLATNFGLQALPDVDVFLTGAVMGEANIALDFVEKEAVMLHLGWLPPSPGDYELIAYTVTDGDEDPENDSLRIVVHVLDAASAPDSFEPTAIAASVWPNPSCGTTWFSLAMPEGLPAQVGIFSVSGRRVAGWSLPAGPERRIVQPWNGRDRKGNDLPGGVYFLRLRLGDRDRILRIVRSGG